MKKYLYITVNGLILIPAFVVLTAYGKQHNYNPKYNCFLKKETTVSGIYRKFTH